MKKFLARSILSIVIASSVGVVHSAVLEEVIVTAQQRAESLQDVPVSVAAVTAEKMSDAGVVDLQGCLSMYLTFLSMKPVFPPPLLFAVSVLALTLALNSLWVCTTTVFFMAEVSWLECR